MALLCLLPVLSIAQPNFELSSRSIERVTDIDNPVKKLRLYKKLYHRDSIEQIKAYERESEYKVDSLQYALIMAIENGQGRTSRNFRRIKRHYESAQIKRAKYAKTRTKVGSVISDLDSIRISVYDSTLGRFNNFVSKINLFEDSLAPISTLTPLSGARKFPNATGTRGLVESKLAKQTASISQHVKPPNEISEVKALSQQYSQTQVIPEGQKYLKQPEELINDHNIDQLGGIQQQVKESNSLKSSLPGKMPVEVDSASIIKRAREKGEALAMDYITEKPEIIKGIQKKMDVLMKKYSIVPNSSDLSTAVKRNSLKGKSFKRRITWAANLQMMSLDPIAFDLTPQIGYRFNKDFIIGLGGMYRQTFADTVNGFSATAFGYNVFLSYDVLTKFLVYLEYGATSKGAIKMGEEINPVWEPTLNVGVGRKISMGPKIDMTIVCTYDLLFSREKSVNLRPWSVRIGFRTTDLFPMKKMKQ